MANTVIQLKKSATPSASPSSLAYGELAINYADGVLYYKSSNNAIASFYSRNPSYGTINAAGTLVISDQVDDILDIRAGNNITITGDAINDRITIAADLTSANSWANTKLTNGSVTLDGTLTTTSQITANGVVAITPVGGQEGGEIQLQATGSNTNWTIDSYQNNIRVFASSGTSVSNLNFFHAVGGGSVRLGVNKTDPEYTVDVSGDINATGSIRINGTPITTSSTDLIPANNWANTINTAVQTSFPAVNNYTISVGASANNWANTKLANTSDVSFNGNLNFPTGNVTIGSSTFSKEMRVLSLVSDTSDYPTSGRGIFYITGANSTTSSNTSIVFLAYDTTSAARHGAAIQMGKDGAWTGGSGVYPGFMSFWTRESGGTNAEVERMRITSAGNIGIGTPSPTSNLHVIGTANISSATLLVAGQNVLSSISTVGESANNWANTKLANTSGITFAGSLTFTGNVTTSQTMFAQHFDNTSDISLKQNITPIDDPMIVLSQLNPVSFNWKDGGRKSFGLIAQDVEKVLPEIINIREDGIKSLSYIDIISFLIAAVKQQQEDINTLNSRLDDLTK